MQHNTTRRSTAQHSTARLACAQHAQEHPLRLHSGPGPGAPGQLACIPHSLLKQRMQPNVQLTTQGSMLIYTHNLAPAAYTQERQGDLLQEQMLMHAHQTAACCSQALSGKGGKGWEGKGSTSEGRRGEGKGKASKQKGRL